jgi:hypothetical protein
VVAGAAAVGGDGAVEAVDDCARWSDALVKAVHVLGDDGCAARLQRGDRVVGGVGVDRVELAAPPVVPVVDELWIGGEALRAGQLVGVILAPEGVGGCAAEGGDAAVGADACAGEDDEAAGVGEDVAGVGEVSHKT